MSDFSYPPRKPQKRVGWSQTGTSNAPPDTPLFVSAPQEPKPPKRFFVVVEQGEPPDPKSIFVYPSQKVAERHAADLKQKTGKAYVVHEMDQDKTLKDQVQPGLRKVPNPEHDTIYRLATYKEPTSSVTAEPGSSGSYLSLVVWDEQDKESKISIRMEKEKLQGLAKQLLERLKELS